MLTIQDSGIRSGTEHMAIDRAALAATQSGLNHSPTLRFFQWDRPTVSYGYLLNYEGVKEWATKIENRKSKIDLVQRPTGGGAVWHSPTDLSFSILWRRGEGLFSENPRTCYAEIHARARDAAQLFFEAPLHLFSKSVNICAEQIGAKPIKRFSACFEEPVCNDVMLNQKKIVGGALRVTRQALLYQGTIQLEKDVNVENIKNRLAETFQNATVEPTLA